ncbi:response regulator [Aquabacterium sp. J223]|uniref:response regulator n=1 Tax=Aquabacterium sp. J223 TaxID=2898431 RepID=UPI0021ADE2AD|nr:response regulator transcription factor [Aquabacterium sp. J223]UUX97191.1 response regulator transcription factor [Aquabacterium sp. J223]
MTPVLIVDDHPILRHGIGQLVGRESDFTVCGEAGSVDEALTVLATRHVELMVVDLSLEQRSGLELIRLARSRHPQVRSLVLSMHDERLQAERALRAGARGYVMKQEATRKIVAALRAVREGQVYVSEAIASDLLERLTGAAEASPGGLKGLSEREAEVLRLIGRGLKTGEIARALHRSVHTIETHRASIKRKLGLKTAAELSRAAYALDDEAR